MLLGGICPTPCAPYFRLSQGICTQYSNLLSFTFAWLTEWSKKRPPIPFFLTCSCWFLHPNNLFQLALYDELMRSNYLRIYESCFQQFFSTIFVMIFFQLFKAEKKKYCSKFVWTSKIFVFIFNCSNCKIGENRIHRLVVW